MKKSLFLAFLAFCAPIGAQSPAPAPPDAPASTPQSPNDEPRRWDFGFHADAERAENQIAWRRLFDDERKDEFFDHKSGVLGVPLSETVTFSTEKGQKLAVLTAFFSKNGKIARQELRDAKNKVVSLVIVAPASAKLPKIAIKNSGVTLETVVKNGFLVRRSFVLQTPLWTGSVVSLYDARGRRQRDVFTRKKDGYKNEIAYFYGAQGLTSFEIPKTSDEPSRNALLKRDGAGKLLEMRYFENGKLQGVSTTLREKTGKMAGTQAETFRDGVLESVIEVRGNADSVTFIERDAKRQIRERRIFNKDILMSLEEFEAGKLRYRTEFDLKGAPKTQTQFQSDGSIDWTK